MTAFLKIDDCKTCHRNLPWEWIPAVPLSGKTLAGTGVSHSQLTDDLCPACHAALEIKRKKEQGALAMRAGLVQLLGGEKPYREFTLERYKVTPENQFAYESCKDLNPATSNLYLRGACGVGKTHLAYAVARRCFEETLSVAILLAYQLSRKVRMKDPDREQAAINELVDTEVLVLDDLGTGPETAYTQQILQEILDGRQFHDHAGLVVTSTYSLDELAQKMGNDAIPSRLAGMCAVVEIRGNDRRLPAR